MMPWIAQWWGYVILGVVLIVAAVTDIRYGRIYNAVTYPAIVIGLASHALLGHWNGHGGQPGLLAALAALGAGTVPLLVAWLAGGIGGGDVKLMAGVGALTADWRFTLATLFCGLIVAAIMAIVVIFRRRIARRTLGRLWRFFYQAFIPGPKTDPATGDSPKIPFGVALCIGAALVLLDVAIRGSTTTRWPLGI